MQCESQTQIQRTAEQALRACDVKFLHSLDQLFTFHLATRVIPNALTCTLLIKLDAKYLLGHPLRGLRVETWAYKDICLLSAIHVTSSLRERLINDQLVPQILIHTAAMFQLS